MQDYNLELKLDEYLPLRDVVFNTLRQAILTGELKSGERLMELHLAKKLGVSRTPIREAIRMLELEGLVTMIPRKGAEVSALSKQDITDVLEVRRSLDMLAVSLCCKRHKARRFCAFDRSPVQRTAYRLSCRVCAPPPRSTIRRCPHRFWFS